MDQKPRILIVDDEPQLTRVLRTGLKTRGYDVRVAADGISGLEIFGDWQPDLLVTDLAMPNMDGLELCRSVRAISQVPIIVLSAKGEEKTKVAALDVGADDYVTKPFGMDELLARLRAALRRSAPSEAAPVVRTPHFTVDLAAKQASTVDGPVRLTPTEWHLLEVLIRHDGKLGSQRQLLLEVWGPAYDTQTNYLRVYMAQLRRKLEADPAHPQHLLTEPGMGYRFTR